MAQPWWSFNRIDNFGQIDPEGPYYKPDSNILTPPGYPITAILSGVVTNVRRTSWGQTVVTVKLDTPYNSNATHTEYQHMHDATVAQGQHLNQGDLLGHANYKGEGANLGFGFYHGDIYGSGPGWNELQADLCPGCPNTLNPVKLLDSAKAGNIQTSGGNGTTGIGGTVTNLLGIDPTQIVVWGEYIAIFVLAVVFGLLGIYLLGGQPIEAAGNAIAAPVKYVANRRTQLKA